MSKLGRSIVVLGTRTCLFAYIVATAAYTTLYMHDSK